MANPEESKTEVENALSVVDRVLNNFIESVSAENGCREIAERLKDILLNKRDLSEAALEHALFGPEQS